MTKEEIYNKILIWIKRSLQIESMRRNRQRISLRISIWCPAYIVKTTFPGDFSLKSYIEERAISIANYIIENNATVRQTAREFKVSKSTVHKDVTERLLQLNPSLAKCARKVLDVNKQERHIRGGMATREKYLHKVQK